MNAKPHQPLQSSTEPGTLGDLLYAGHAQRCVPEAAWVALVRSIAEGNQRALQELYWRSHRLVFTLTMRLTNDRSAAEELTLDVFQQVWRGAAKYDPAAGTVLGWIMNQARSRAIDHLRFEHRKKRTRPEAPDPSAATVCTAADEMLERAERAQLVRQALNTLPPHERSALETAYFQELTYREAAARLSEPVGTVKTRIRSALQKLRAALAAADLSP